MSFRLPFWRQPKPLTVILGAGASLCAGAPSTTELTALVDKFSERADREGEVCRRILTALRSTFRTVNFEVVINALEELEGVAFAYSGRDLVDEYRPVLASFLAPKEPPLISDPGILSEVRHRLLYEIASHCYQRTYAAKPEALQALFAATGAEFALRIFTLNYDELIDRAGTFVDGFTTRYNPQRIPWAWPVLVFDAKEFARARASRAPLLAHLHGSVQFGYQIECTGIVKYDAPINALASFSESRTPQVADHGSIMTAGPIISGFNKVAKVAGNPEPYAHYYAAFTEALLSVERVLVIGYGAMDAYVNTWLHQFARAHSNQRRIAWVTHIPGSAVGSNRADIRLLHDLAGTPAFPNSNAYDRGESFQIQGPIALECSGFPLRGDRLEAIVRHLAS